MTIELKMLLWSVILGIIYILVQASFGATQRSGPWLAGPRDDVKPPLTGMAGRFDRALRNYGETFPLFAAAVLLAQALDRHNNFTAWGAQAFFWGRLIYLPLYGLGVPWVRTLVWFVATLGIALVVYGTCQG